MILVWRESELPVVRVKSPYFLAYRESKLPVRQGAEGQNYRLARVETTEFGVKSESKLPIRAIAESQNYLPIAKLWREPKLPMGPPLCRKSKPPMGRPLCRESKLPMRSRRWDFWEEAGAPEGRVPTSTGWP